MSKGRGQGLNVQVETIGGYIRKKVLHRIIKLSFDILLFYLDIIEKLKIEKRNFIILNNNV